MVKLFRYKKTQKQPKNQEDNSVSTSSSIVGGSYKTIKPDTIKASPSPSPMSFNTRERLKKFVNLKL
jgi:hypothetical protein